MDFKERLALLRREKEVKQTDLATQCGVSRATVIRWENGKVEPSLSELQHIAKALGVSVSNLIGETPDGDDRIILRAGALSLEIPTTEAGLEFLEKRLKAYSLGEKFSELSLDAG